KTLKDMTAKIWAKVNEEDSVFRKGLSLASDVIGVISIVGLPAAIQSFLDFINGNNPLRDALTPIEFIPLSFWHDSPLISQYSVRRHDPWLVYGSPSYSPARWSSSISPA